jgi:hypothetical protein
MSEKHFDLRETHVYLRLNSNRRPVTPEAVVFNPRNKVLLFFEETHPD